MRLRENNNFSAPSPAPDNPANSNWWGQFVTDEELEEIHLSSKLLMLFEIIKGCKEQGDKL